MPRGVLGARAGKHILEGGHEFGPACSIFKIIDIEFPVFFWVVEASLQALFLLFVGDQQEEFNNFSAFIAEHLFKGVDVFVAFGPDAFWGEFFYLHSEDVFVVAAVEDGDLSFTRYAVVDAP